MQDVIIIGGGPAGLNAAVVLGRCRRKVLLFDTGQQRNRLSKGMHNYLTRDGILPGDFLALARNEAKRYGVKMIRKEIIHAEKIKATHFTVKDTSGKVYHSRKLLIATGLRDNLPDFKNIGSMYGKSVFHCPYCDAWEVRDKKIAVYGPNKNAIELAMSLKTWSKEVCIFTNGKRFVTAIKKKLLDKNDIGLVTKKIDNLDGRNGRLKNIVCVDGTKYAADALFFTNGYQMQCDIAKTLGCTMSRQGVVITNRRQQANIPGLYVAGDVSKDMHFVVVAAGEGAKAGVSINKELQKEELSANSF